MKVLVAGSSGLVGTALCEKLKKHGHQVFRLVRSFTQFVEDSIYWDPQIGEVKTSDLEGFDAVINLAGDNIASGRWSQKKKSAILRSRVDSTRLLCEAFLEGVSPPKVIINASAVGYYGDRGEEILNEESESGEGFLAEVCQLWEEAAGYCHEKGVRVVSLRFGVVLTPNGGALKQMLTPFNMYLGGVVGSGKQYMSWIHIDDVIGIIEHVMEHDEITGPINAVSPNPVTNREFTKTLGEALNRPTLLPLPAFVVELIFGEMGKELLLGSTRAEAKKIQKAGYSFQYPELGKALEDLLNV